MPWLVLAGSGGLADFLSDVLDNLSSATAVQSSGEGNAEASPSVDLKDKVAERVKKHFPAKKEQDKLVELVSAVDGDVCSYSLASVMRNRKKLFNEPQQGWIAEILNFVVLVDIFFFNTITFLPRIFHNIFADVLLLCILAP